MTESGSQWDPVFEKLIRSYLPALSPDQLLERDLPLRASGFDSLAAVSLLADIEEAYELEFPDELLAIETFETPGVLWQAIAGLRSGA